MIYSNWAFIGLWVGFGATIGVIATLTVLDALSTGIRALVRRIRAGRR